MKSLPYTRGVAVGVVLALLCAQPALAIAGPTPTATAALSAAAPGTPGSAGTTPATGSTGTTGSTGSTGSTGLAATAVHRVHHLHVRKARHAPALSAKALAAQSGENIPLHLGGGSAHGSPAASGGTGASLVRTLVALLVVIAVIYGISWILKQFRAGRSRSTGRGLEKLATLPLSGNRSVSLVRVGNELILLGVAEQSVTALRRYTEDEALLAGLRLDAIDAHGEFIADDDPLLLAEPIALADLTSAGTTLPSAPELPAHTTRPSAPGLPAHTRRPPARGLPAHTTRPQNVGELAGRMVESLRALTVRH